MDSNLKQRWLKLCELASTEQDPTRLSELVQQILDLSEETPHCSVRADPPPAKSKPKAQNPIARS